MSSVVVSRNKFRLNSLQLVFTESMFVASFYKFI